MILFKSCARCGGDVDATFESDVHCVQCGHRPAVPPLAAGLAGAVGAAPVRLVSRLPLRPDRPAGQAARDRPHLLPVPDMRTHLQPPRKRAETCRLLTQQASSPLTRPLHNRHTGEGRYPEGWGLGWMVVVSNSPPRLIPKLCKGLLTGED